MTGDGFVGGPDFDLFLQVFNGPPGAGASAATTAAVQSRPSAQRTCGLGFELAALLPALLRLRRRRASAVCASANGCSSRATQDER